MEPRAARDGITVYILMLIDKILAALCVDRSHNYTEQFIDTGMDSLCGFTLYLSAITY